MNFLEIILTVIATILAALLATYLTNWYKRPKPWIGISSIDRDDSSLVSIPEEIRELSDKCHWTDTLEENEPLYKVLLLKDSLTQSIKTINEVLNDLVEFETIINKNTLSLDEKRRAIQLLVSNSQIRSILISMNLRHSLPIPTTFSPTDNDIQVLKFDEIDDPQSKEKGIMINFEDRRYFLTAGSGLVGPENIKRTKQLSQVLTYFLTDYLKQIIVDVKREVTNDKHILLDINDKIQTIIKSRNLIIKAKISNLGAKPLHIKPFGLLRIKSSGKNIKPMIIEVKGFRLSEAGMDEMPRLFQLIEGLALKQGVQSSRTPKLIKDMPEYIIINPGTLGEIEFGLINESLEDSVISALETGILGSQLIVWRADNNKFIKSGFQTMGLRLSDEERHFLENQSKNL